MPDTQISDALGLIDGGLQLLLAAVHADDPKREMLVRVGDLLRDVRSLQAALSGHVVGWRTMDSAPKDGTWILIGDDHCWPPDLVRWQPERPRRVINGNNHLAIPAGWFGSPGGRSRFDMPDGHLMKATHWQPLPGPPVQEMEG